MSSTAGEAGRRVREAKLVEKAREGDAAYWGLVRDYQRLVFRTAYLITGDSAEVAVAPSERRGELMTTLTGA